MFFVIYERGGVSCLNLFIFYNLGIVVICCVLGNLLFIEGYVDIIYFFSRVWFWVFREVEFVFCISVILSFFF